MLRHYPSLLCKRSRVVQKVSNTAAGERHRGGSTRESWMETSSLIWPVLHWERQSISQVWWDFVLTAAVPYRTESNRSFCDRFVGPASSDEDSAHLLMAGELRTSRSCCERVSRAVDRLHNCLVSITHDWRDDHPPCSARDRNSTANLFVRCWPFIETYSQSCTGPRGLHNSHWPVPRLICTRLSWLVDRASSYYLHILRAAFTASYDRRLQHAIVVNGATVD